MTLLLATAAVPEGAAARTYTVRHVTFHSPALGAEAAFDIALPSDYSSRSAPLPVLYFLHGANAPVVGGADALAPDRLRALEPYRIAYVVPDPTEEQCPACGYVDGLDGLPGLRWEQFFLKDLMPYVESHFNVRPDRAGRGVTGFSMGGFGAGFWSTKHPDLFAFAGSLSGPMHLFLNPETTATGMLLAPQIGDPATHEWRWHDVNPWDLAPNLVGQPIRVLVGSGDGRREGDPSSGQGGSGGCSPGQPVEYVACENAIAYHSRLMDLGVPHRFFIRSPGGHGIPPSLFSDQLLPAAAEAFAANLSARPAYFDYRTMSRAFSIWGYDVAVERPNREFLYMQNVARRGLRVLGTGMLSITTAPLYIPGVAYAVTFTTASSSWTETLGADGSGRLTIRFRAGTERQVDQRQVLELAGGFDFPETTIEIARPRETATARPRLSLKLRRVRGGVRATVGGRDVGLVRRVDFLAGGRRLARDAKPPFSKLLPRAKLARTGSRKVRARVTLASGRELTLSRKLRSSRGY